jgi:hypothetical protein
LILEAFAQHLRNRTHSGRYQTAQKPEKILYEWLVSILSQPPAPDDPVSRVVHTEIALTRWSGHFSLEGKSDTGQRLLYSLTQFCRSYDHWQFTRWVHQVRASDFQRKFGA